MNLRLLVVSWIAIAMAVASTRAEKPLKDYSFVRGVNHHMRGDQAVLERDLGYARRLNLNSTRIWLNYQAYERDPQAYLAQLQNYIRTSHRLGFTTMPILWNGNNLNPDTLKQEFRERGDAYVKAVVEAVKNEPGLLMWDIMNEPMANDYYHKAPEAEKEQHKAEISAFVRYYATYVKQLDPVNATTVGHDHPELLEDSADLVDVLSLHNYTPTRASIEADYDTAEALAKKYGKPFLNTETGCIARANPYDVVLQIAEERKTGWYLFNLMISGYWGEVHGIFYPDGTVRDPAIVAAIMGFYRNRDLNTIIRAFPDREGEAARAIKRIQDAMNEGKVGFGRTDRSTDKILDAAEYAANLLESAQKVPMDVPPTAEIRYWREMPVEKRNQPAIRELAYRLQLELQRVCQL